MDTGLPTKDETVKTTQKSWNMTIWSLMFGSWIQSSILMVYLSSTETVLVYKEPWMQENGLNRFRTIVSKVSSFVGNPVTHL